MFRRRLPGAVAAREVAPPEFVLETRAYAPMASLLAKT